MKVEEREGLIVCVGEGLWAVELRGAWALVVLIEWFLLTCYQYVGSDWLGEVPPGGGRFVWDSKSAKVVCEIQ